MKLPGSDVDQPPACGYTMVCRGCILSRTLVNKVFLPMALLLLAGAPIAHARQSTLTMTCEEAALLVATRGAVVLSTGRYTYARFVASPGYCALAEYAYRGRAPTRDGQCRLGFVCEPHSPLFQDDDDRGLFGR